MVLSIKVALAKTRWATGAKVHTTNPARFALMLFLCGSPLLSDAAIKILRLYDGPALSRENVVTLLHPTDIAMVLSIDKKIAGGPCFTGCDFRKPVQILPGKHRFVSSNMHMSLFPKDHISNPIPFSSGNVAPLKVLATSLLDVSYEFDFEATLEAGKSYAITVGHVDGNDGKREMYVWWREMPNASLE